MIATLAEAALRSLVLGGVVWFGLNLFRVRNPHVHMTAWVVVLLASLAMPFVMHWPTLTITRLPLPVAVPDDFLPADVSMLETPQPALPVAPGIAIAPQARSGLSINWWLVATVIYAGVAGLLLLRLAIGLCLTWRLARAASNIGAHPGRAARRAVPIANGEAMLRRYIEGVGRGQPDYEHMTSEVADITRQQLPFDQAILARLGALRAVSFRGVTALDSDIYIAQFANGSAEWRIGVRNDTITKIALGPNF
ncbi:hypothetical protein [Bradyrhizobium sp. ERR14]|uniref:hypothetical protein n=1 Tax=Bradyrhizobium sp. ERR14 TaxID=2663837 RepID=UPI0016072949|nr:hypothetical protein [Bradyrhizobium sp. ERR14]MBB4397449.1 hypothetical protein [Bradyrhizobium sp. ERR14]